MSSAEADVDEHLDAILQACEEGDEKWLEELLDDKNHGNMIGLKLSCFFVLLFFLMKCLLILRKFIYFTFFNFILFCVAMLF